MACSKKSKGKGKKKPDIAQYKNPKTMQYVKIDRSNQEILDVKTKGKGPFKNVPVGRKR